MDVVEPGNGVELNAESRAKRVFVSVEPIPDRRIFRVDASGAEDYDKEQAPEDRITLFAQLIHEPERQEPDKSVQKIEQGLGTAKDQFQRLNNLAQRLQSQESEFRVSIVNPPPLDPIEAENSTMAAYQSRQNQLRRSSELLNGALSRLKETVHHQRGFHDDLLTLRRSRWRLNSPDQIWRKEIWSEPLNTIVRRISGSFRALDLVRTSDGTLSALMPHQLTGVQVRIEAHSLDHVSPTPYYATGLRNDVSDLYRPLSNSYTARSTLNIHRLWMWVTKSYEDYSFWSLLWKLAASEGMETRAEEIIIPMPNSSFIFSVRLLNTKNSVSRRLENTTVGNNASAMASPKIQPSSSMDLDEPPAVAEPTATNTSASDKPTHEKQRKRRRAPGDDMQARRVDSLLQSDSLAPKVKTPPTSRLAQNDYRGILEEYELDNGDEGQAILDSNLDVAITQDLLLLTLKQAYLFLMNGNILDQTRFPVFPVRRLAAPTAHSLFAPATTAVHHFRTLCATSRLLDDLCYSLPRLSALGPLHVHFEPTSLATVSTLHVNFCTLHLTFSINAGTFRVSPTEDLDDPSHFIQHLSQLFAAYIIENVQNHVNALCGPHTTSLLHSRSVTFPLGVSHPLSHATAKPIPQNASASSSLTTLYATFELPFQSPFGLGPTLVVRSRIPGVTPPPSFKLPLDTNVWFTLEGNNFADKLTSLVLASR